MIRLYRNSLQLYPDRSFIIQVFIIVRRYKREHCYSLNYNFLHRRYAAASVHLLFMIENLFIILYLLVLKEIVSVHTFNALIELHIIYSVCFIYIWDIFRFCDTGKWLPLQTKTLPIKGKVSCLFRFNRYTVHVAADRRSLTVFVTYRDWIICNWWNFEILMYV